MRGAHGVTERISERGADHIAVERPDRVANSSTKHEPNRESIAISERGSLGLAKFDPVAIAVAIAE